MSGNKDQKKGDYKLQLTSFEVHQATAIWRNLFSWQSSKDILCAFSCLAVPEIAIFGCFLGATGASSLVKYDNSI